MTQRITCYVIFVTLICGAFAENQEKLRDTFQSNMTRNDFSNLLKSLIKLNEQRVSVLQKLYKLKDYGVLSEVLQSGDKKAGNGSQDNLYLVVLSKNQTDPSRRSLQVVDLVPSLNNGNIKIHTPEKRSKTHSNKEHVLEPVGGSYTIIHLKPNQFKLNVGDNNKMLRTKNRFEIIDGSNNTINPSNKMQVGLIDIKKSGQKNLPRIAKNSSKANKIPNKGLKGRYEIVSTGRGRLNVSEEVEYNDDNRNYPSIAGDHGQKRIQYPGLDISEENDHNTKSIKLKDISSNEHQSSDTQKVDIDASDDYSLINKFISISADTSDENNHNSKYTKKNRDNISNEDDNDDKSSTINRGNPNKNGYANKYNKITKHISIENDQSNTYRKIKRDSDEQYNGIKLLKVNKEKSKENSHRNLYSKLIKDKSNENDHRINHNMNRNNINGNDHSNQYSKINRDLSKENGHHGNKYLNLNRDNTKENDHTSKNYKIKVDDSRYQKITNDAFTENGHGNMHPRDVEDNSKENKPIAVKDSSYEDHNKKPKIGREFDGGYYDTFGKMGFEDYGGDDKAYSNFGRNKLQEDKHHYSILPELQPENKPELRKNFQKCISKKALKMCSKSCISAFKNVCQRLKCTSRSKKALKKECKKSCKKTFSSSSSKYSSEEES